MNDRRRRPRCPRYIPPWGASLRRPDAISPAVSVVTAGEHRTLAGPNARSVASRRPPGCSQRPLERRRHDAPFLAASRVAETMRARKLRTSSRDRFGKEDQRRPQVDLEDDAFPQLRRKGAESKPNRLMACP